MKFGDDLTEACLLLDVPLFDPTGVMLTCGLRPWRWVGWRSEPRIGGGVRPVGTPTGASDRDGAWERDGTGRDGYDRGTKGESSESSRGGSVAGAVEGPGPGPTRRPGAPGHRRREGPVAGRPSVGPGVGRREVVGGGVGGGREGARGQAEAPPRLCEDSTGPTQPGRVPGGWSLTLPL